MNKGYIRLHRQAIESAIWSKPPLYWKVWCYLLMLAQHTDYKNLKRGQLYISIPDIIEGLKYKVGARTERHTKDQIYQVIEFLRKPDEGGNESNAGATMIATTKATHGYVVTILNYSKFQADFTDESNDESNDEKPAKPARKQRKANNINKECSLNGNNEQILSDDSGIEQIAVLIIDKLNQELKLHGMPGMLRATTQSYRQTISARLNENFKVPEFFQIIEFKVKQWVGTQWDIHLTPDTLFSKKHFNTYLQQASMTTMRVVKPIQKQVNY